MTKIAKLDTKTKLEMMRREAEDAVFAEMDNQQEIEIDEKFKTEALLAIGMISAVPAIVKSVNAHLGAKHILALREFQERKLYKALGHDNFADFLTNSPCSPMTKNQYFDRLNLILKEGEETYDLLNEIGISNRDRKRLPPESVRIVGDEILVNDYAVPMGNNSEVKAVVADLIRNWGNAEKTAKTLADEKTETEKQVEALKEQVKLGVEQYEMLDRAATAQQSGTAYEQAFTKTVGALINLALAAKNATILEKEARGRGDVEMLWNQMLVVRHELYQNDFVFTVEANTDNPKISKDVMDAIAETGDFDDADE